MNADTPPAAASCPAGLDARSLRDQVVAMYHRVAREPAADAFHFNVGRDYAIARLGYGAPDLATLPDRCTARFAGVGNPLLAGAIPAGSVVLDHACGAGMDLLLAARQAGPAGRAIGVDITPAMREQARRSAIEAGLGSRVDILAGSFDALPLPDACVDVVISNGVLNLAVDKGLVMREAFRVLRPGGRLRLADVVLDRELSAIARGNASLWAACVGGALTEAALLAVLAGAGFVDVRIAARHDCFAGTPIPHKFRGGVAVTSATLSARKPA